MRELPYRDSQLVKLAYFGGMSNREIADHMRMAEGTVERRLRRALDTISRYIERGRGLSHRLAVALMVWLSGRWLSELAQSWAPVGAVAAATVIILAQPAAPARTGQADPHAQPSFPSTTMTVVPPVPSPTIPATEQSAAPPTVGVPAPVPVPSIQVPSVTLPVPLPTVPPLPVKKEIL